VRTLDDLVAGSLATRRFIMLLLVAFAAIAVGLTGVGVYGVVAQSVEQSTRELGVRLALGATPRKVMSTVLSRSLRLAALGVAAGLIGARLLGPAMGSLLFGVAPTDAMTQALAVVMVAVTTSLAAYLPARRILRIDIVDALRVE
jgi:ABC-type antimicrobial peptide transport system permease subunit